MKQIILIRHAKVDIDHSEKINADSLKIWVELYDTANIVTDSLPAQETINVAKSADVLVTSSLRRTIDSAKVLGVDIYESNAVFNEALISEVNIPFLKLKPKSWLALLRVLFLLGLGKKDASLKASKLQAKKAIERLLELSDGHESVVLVGHGGMNWFIRKALMKEGWSLDPKVSSKNWGMTVLTI
jgi:broad specificity phosphatase PhoE